MASDLRDSGRNPFRRDLAEEVVSAVALSGETAFEKVRGVNRIETRRGFVSARVWGLVTGDMQARLQVLNAVYHAQISIDFLKLTQDGLSFVAHQSEHGRLEDVLTEQRVEHAVSPERVVFIIHAVNMRDEEGMVARLVSEVIASGAGVEHMGEMHDRLLMLMDQGDAVRAREAILKLYPEAEVGA